MTPAPARPVSRSPLPVARALVLATALLAGPGLAAAEEHGTATGPGPEPISTAVLDTLLGRVSAEVERLRGHSFVREVPVRVVDDGVVRGYTLERLETLLPPDRIRAEGEVYEDLGLFPPGLDPVELVLRMVREQVAGLYVPERGEVLLLDDHPAAAASVLLAHELTHALDDQLFDFDAQVRALPYHADRLYARAAAREGSGTVVMTMFLMGESMAGRLGVDALREITAQEEEQKRALQSLPPVMARSLLAPYLLGQNFVLRGQPSRMWSGSLPADLDTVLVRPPVSTEQVLHPEKYWSADERDRPREIVLPRLASVAGEAWSEVAEGTVGELDLACLTGDCALPTGLTAGRPDGGWIHRGAAGWDGDRWQLLRDGSGSTITVLAVVWDDAAEAEEFERTLRRPAGAAFAREDDRTVLVTGDAPKTFPRLLRAALEGLEVGPEEDR